MRLWRWTVEVLFPAVGLERKLRESDEDWIDNPPTGIAYVSSLEVVRSSPAWMPDGTPAAVDSYTA